MASLPASTESAPASLLAGRLAPPEKAPLANYAAGLLVYGAGVALAWNVPYYGYDLLPLTRWTLLVLYWVYGFLGIPFYFLGKGARESVPLLALRALARPARALAGRGLPLWAAFRMRREEKVAVLFLLVKVYFLPMMLNFVFGNYGIVAHFFGQVLAGRPDAWFFLAMSGIALVDVTVFCFAYTLDFHALGNKIRSVEPTLAGWAVCLVCYPPFAGLASAYAGWYAFDGVRFPTSLTGSLGRAAILLLFVAYVSATLALGFKASNLTNRGIVTRGPYRFVRHPGYTSKVLAWWVMVLPVLSWPAVFSMITWSVIYMLRGITEERHLLKDPDYRAYCDRVRWRFIPGVY